jgi:hypothetical protein
MGSIIRAPIKIFRKAVDTVTDVPRTILGGIGLGGGSDPAPAPEPEVEEEELVIDTSDGTEASKKRIRFLKKGGGGTILGGYGVLEKKPHSKSIVKGS